MKSPHAWDYKTAYYTAVNKELEEQVRLLELSFVEWYKALTPAARESWMKDMIEYDLQCEADETYKKFLDRGVKVAEEMREMCFMYERVVHESNYGYLTEDINVAMAKDYDRYVADIYKQIVDERVERTMDIFRIEEKEMSTQSLLALNRVIKLVNIRNQFDRLNDLGAPKIIIDDAAEYLIARVQDIKRGCTTEELEAINDLYDIFLARQENKYKLKKRLLSAVKKHMPIVRETYETWTSAVNKKNDIYRKMARAPGSGFSRQ